MLPHDLQHGDWDASSVGREVPAWLWKDKGSALCYRTYIQVIRPPGPEAVAVGKQGHHEANLPHMRMGKPFY